MLIAMVQVVCVCAGLKYSRTMRDLRDQTQSGGRPMPFMPPDESDEKSP